jgi:fructose-specific phosphotransferase system IIA component
MELKASTKEDAIRELASIMAAQGRITDTEDFIKHIFERERLGSTGIGNNVAIPHCPTRSVKDLAIGFGRSTRGIDFSSADGKEVKYIFLMGTNPEQLNVYLKFLAGLSKLLEDQAFRIAFSGARSADDLITLFRKYERD